MRLRGGTTQACVDVRARHDRPEGALAIQGEYTINAPRETVWAALNDPETLQACIPGCETITKLSDTELEARVNAALGPVRASFATRIVLSNLNPPESYTLSGEGKAAAGFGKGTANVSLAEDGGRTTLRYEADLKLGGKLAQVGSRLLEGATRNLADQFFDAFSKRLDAGATGGATAGGDAASGVSASSDAPNGDASAASAHSAAAGARSGLNPWLIAAALALVAIVVWYATAKP